jgi:hypothetical protein
MVAATPIAPEILDSFIIFLWSGPYNTNARPPFFFSWHSLQSKNQVPNSRQKEVQWDFRPQLTTIKIQTHSILPKKQNQNLASPIPQKENPLLSFSSTNFI